MTERQAGAAAAALIGSVVVLDVFLGRRSLLLERPPDWSFPHASRTVLLAAASILIVVGLRRAVDRWPMRNDTVDGRWTRASASIGVVTAMSAATIVVTDPRAFSALVQEDGVVEWASAGLAFMASAAFSLAAGRIALSENQDLKAMSVMITLCLAGLSFLIAMEEVSWFQRVLDVESPAFVRGRNQPEFNLHNAATDLSENVYYFGGFALTVMIPGLLGPRRLPAPVSGLERVLPTRAVMFGSIAAGALVYEMWEIILIQIVFFASLALLLTEPPSTRRMGIVVAIAMVVVAMVFVGTGHRMTRSWDDTEVRELLLPFGLFLYGFDLIRRSSARSRSRYRLSLRSADGLRKRSSAQVTTRRSSTLSTATPTAAA